MFATYFFAGPFESIGMYIYRERNNMENGKSLSGGCTGVHYTSLLKFLYVENDYSKLGKIHRKFNTGGGE